MAAAQAGYKVAAFDIFNDDETRRFSFVSERVGFRDGGFESGDLWDKLVHTLPKGTPVLYGSGLESQPALVDQISRHFKLIGNAAETVSLVKQPFQFFPLLETLGIPYPETCMSVQTGGEWLAKKAGGSGGTHIQLGVGGSGDYYQRYINGLPVSVLFLADGQQIEIVGFNEQWLNPTPNMPFRYGGIVSNAGLSESVKDAMMSAASRIASAAKLKGLNSMDFILPADGVPLVLEVNPRLSASFSLYDDQPGLFRQHLHACDGDHFRVPKQTSGARAATVYYADDDFVIDSIEWPAWTTDRPAAGTYCRMGEPVCTVLAEGHDASSTKALVFARVRELDAQLRTFTIPPGK